MKETKKVIAVKDVIDKVKDSLEIDGVYINNTIEEQDSDVRPLLEEMMASISRIEHSLLFEESKYNDNLNSLENFEIVSQKAVQAQTEVDNNILKLSEIIDTINLEIDEQIEEELECAPLKLKLDKKVFSPNNDGIDDSVTFTITAPKDKTWTLDIISTENNTVKTITGTGTGEQQTQIWDGLDNSNIVSEDDFYKVKITSNGETLDKELRVHNYNYLTMITYPEEDSEGETEITEDTSSDMTFTTTADVEPPKSAFVEYVKDVVKQTNVNSKADLINESIEQALKTVKEKNALAKAEILSRKTLENTLKSYKPNSKSSYNSYLKTFGNVLSSFTAYMTIKDIFVSNQDIEIVTIDTNHIDTYQSECKSIKFKATLQSSGLAPDYSLKGKWKIYYLFKDGQSDYIESSEQTLSNAILVKSIDAEAKFKFDQADLSMNWDGRNSLNKKSRDGKYMAVFVPKPDNDNLILPNTGIKFTFKTAAAFLFNIIDTDKIANDVKTKIIGNNAFSTNSISGMSGNFVGAKIPMISAGSIEVKNSLHKLDIAGKKLYGDFVNSSKQYGSELSSGIHPWVSPLVKGLEDVIDPYNMAGVLSVMPNGKTILDEAIKNDNCSKFAPKSLFLKTVRAFLPVVNMDSTTNLKPVTSHNKDDLFNQIADSNAKFRLTYLNTLRALNNPYATDRTIAKAGGEGSDVTFEGVGLNQVKYVEIKCTTSLDEIKSARAGYVASLTQINRSREMSPEQLSLSFVQIVNTPADGMSVLNKFSYDLRTATSTPDIRDLTKNVYFSLVSKNGTLSVDSEEVKIPPKK